MNRKVFWINNSNSQLFRALQLLLIFSRIVDFDKQRRKHDKVSIIRLFDCSSRRRSRAWWIKSKLHCNIICYYKASIKWILYYILPFVHITKMVNVYRTDSHCSFSLEPVDISSVTKQKIQDLAMWLYALCLSKKLHRFGITIDLISYCNWTGLSVQVAILWFEILFERPLWT